MTLPTSKELEAARALLFSYLTQDYCGRGCDEVMLQKRVDESLAILLDAFHAATLASLTPSGEVLEAAAKAMAVELYHDSEWGYCRESENCRHCHGRQEGFQRQAARYLRAAAPVLLADKEREIEFYRDSGKAETAYQLERAEKAESRVAALEGALQSLADAVAEETACQHLDRDDPNRLDAGHQLGKVLVAARTLLDGGTR